LLVQHPTGQPPALADRTHARKWFIGSIALGIALAIAWVGCYLWADQIDRRFAMAPIVGDRWTIDIDDWPEKLEVSGSRRDSMHTVVKVTAVSDDTVDLMACEMAYSDKSDAENKCDTFSVDMDPVARANVGDVYDDAISNVKTERESLWTGVTPYSVGFALTVGLLVLWSVIARQLKKRIGLAEF
jgi:hypothetical protein